MNPCSLRGTEGGSSEDRGVYHHWLDHTQPNCQPKQRKKKCGCFWDINDLWHWLCHTFLCKHRPKLSEHRHTKKSLEYTLNIFIPLFSNYGLSLAWAQDSTQALIHATTPTPYQQVFLDVRSARLSLSAEGTIRTRGVGITSQTPARKETHTVIRAKNPKHVMDFTGLSWFYSHPLQQSAFTVKETAQNNHVAFALTVSKCCVGSFKTQLNFSVPHCHRDRMDDCTELFLKEKYLGCMFLLLALARWMSQLKSIARGNCFCNLFDHIKIGNRFVCCDNVCWVRGSQTVSHSGLLDVCEATDVMSVGLYKHHTLPYPVLSGNLFVWA